MAPPHSATKVAIATFCQGLGSGRKNLPLLSIFTAVAKRPLSVSLIRCIRPARKSVNITPVCLTHLQT
jgi:hypothetical protein